MALLVFVFHGVAGGGRLWAGLPPEEHPGSVVRAFGDTRWHGVGDRYIALRAVVGVGALLCQGDCPGSDGSQQDDGDGEFADICFHTLIVSHRFPKSLARRAEIFTTLPTQWSVFVLLRADQICGTRKLTTKSAKKNPACYFPGG